MQPYKIAAVEGWPKQVEGDVVAPGLAVREDTASDRGVWVIDHLPTGRRLSWFGTEEAARIVADSMSKAFSWDAVTGLADYHERVPKEVIEYINQYLGAYRAAPMGEPAPKPPAVRVAITIEVSATFSVRELWPDGDWPDVVDEDAVRTVIEESGGAEVIVRDWGDFDFDTEIMVFPTVSKRSKSDDR
jgi:hypothetical protein